MKMRSTSAKIALIPLAAMGALALTGGSPAGASAKATTVKAVETDFHIALSKKSFSPGTYTFVAQNKGKTTHALAITGPGLKNADTSDISAGQSVKLTVTLKDGKYDIYCPVPGHKMLGMNVNVTVKGKGAHTTGTKTTPTTSGGGSGGAGF
jgi:ABC-type transport system substrate-binding protein